MTERLILRPRHVEPYARNAMDDPSCRPALAISRFAGRWVIYRSVPRGYARPGRNMPHFHHDTYERAEEEAARLLGIHPESTFVILQERAIVKAKRQA